MSATQPPRQSAEGFVLVPREPGPCMGGSDDMLFAFVSELHAGLNDGAGPSGWHDFSDGQRSRLQRAYRAFIAAAPPPPTQEQELATFHNRLRKLLNVEFQELVDAGVMKNSDGGLHWGRFHKNPWRWFIRASDEDAAKVWAIMEKLL